MRCFWLPMLANSSDPSSCLLHRAVWLRTLLPQFTLAKVLVAGHTLFRALLLAGLDGLCWLQFAGAMTSVDRLLQGGCGWL